MCSHISKWLLIIPAEILGGLEYQSRQRKLEPSKERFSREHPRDSQAQGESLGLRFVTLLLNNLWSRVFCGCMCMHVCCLKQSKNYMCLQCLLCICGKGGRSVKHSDPSVPLHSSLGTSQSPTVKCSLCFILMNPWSLTKKGMAG